MTSATRPRTSAVLVNGQPHYVSPGAVAQDGSLKLMQCNNCGAEVVWATSARTGRRYLVNVSRGYLDQRFYNKRNAHRCPDLDARRARTDAETALFNARSDFTAAMAAWQADVHNAELEAVADAAAGAVAAAKRHLDSLPTA